MARGKGADVLSLEELVGDGKDGTLLDVVLEPGQVGVVHANRLLSMTNDIRWREMCLV